MRSRARWLAGLRRVVVYGGVCVVGAGCVSASGLPGTPGVARPPAMRGTFGAVVPDAPGEARRRTGLHRKRVADKQEPGTLVAADGTRCVVGSARLAKREVGDRVWCVWRAPSDAA